MPGDPSHQDPEHNTVLWAFSTPFTAEGSHPVTNIPSHECSHWIPQQWCWYSWVCPLSITSEWGCGSLCFSSRPVSFSRLSSPVLPRFQGWWCPMVLCLHILFNHSLWVTTIPCLGHCELNIDFPACLFYLLGVYSQNQKDSVIGYTIFIFGAFVPWFS